MEGDRQSQIEQIVKSALSLDADERASFVAEACSDSDLLAEVTRTLGLNQAPVTPEASPADSRIEAIYGAYKVLRRIGVGGMGEVYLAYDTRLGRNVALKFLRTETTGDETLVRRFQLEARNASALNHPNILTIFNVGKFGSEHYIASEFVEGITLRTRMRQGPIPWEEALDFAVQIASALVAAHGAGIIHRDLKPTNIMIRPDGYLKVIDFGLAKRQRLPEASAMGEAQTRPGVMLGTVDYMAPEQARGQEVDARADIWSFGVVLYEMLAGKRPFVGPSEFHVLAHILDGEPRPLAELGVLVPEIEHIIVRCLQKDREKRYQSSSELYADLREARRALQLSSATHASLEAAQAARRRKPLWIAAVCVVTVVLAGAVWWRAFGYDWLVGPEPFEIAESRQVTFNGQTNLAAISPDGKYLAYTWGVPGRESFSLAQIRGGKVDPRSDSVRLTASGYTFGGITFSNDSQSIYYVARQNEVGRLYRISLTGGETELIAVDVDGPPAISPNGDMLAFRRDVNTGKTAQVILKGTRSGAEEKILFSSETLLARRIAWSKESNRIAIFRHLVGSGGRILQVLVLDAEKQVLERTVDVPAWRGAYQGAWLRNGRDLLVSAAAQTESDEEVQLREVSAQTGRTANITNDFYGYRGVGAAETGSPVVTVRLSRETSFWIGSRLNLYSGKIRSADSGRYDSVGWTDDHRLIAQANRGNGVNVWLLDPEGGTPKMMTDGQSRDRNPVWLPGQRAFVFASNREGKSGIWRLNLEDARERLIAEANGYVDSPTVSPDGKTVYYTVWNAANPAIWSVPANGEINPSLVVNAARNPSVSRDGKKLAIEAVDLGVTGGLRVALFNIASGREEMSLSDIPPGSRVKWHPDGSALDYVVTDEHAVSNIWSRPVNSSTAHPITAFAENKIFDYAWSGDGQNLVCLRGHVSMDGILVSRKRGYLGSLFASR